MSKNTRKFLLKIALGVSLLLAGFGLLLLESLR